MRKSILPDKMLILSGSALKLIAALLMVIDHFAVMLLPALPVLEMPLLTIVGKQLTIYALMRLIGRMSFPIFCFLITEGFVHTRNKEKYGLRLLVFAVISEIPFNLLKNNSLFYLNVQNIFFTLFFGVALLYILEKVTHPFQKALFMALVLFLTVVLRTDYKLRGVLLILLMYVLRDRPVEKTVLAIPFFPNIAAFGAFLPIHMYNGQRGFVRSQILQYGFYLFYPVHILLLFALKTLLGGLL